MSSRLPRHDEVLEKEDGIDEMKTNSPPVPLLLKAQQAPALPYAIVVGRPGTGSYPAPSPDDVISAEKCWQKRLPFGAFSDDSARKEICSFCKKAVFHVAKHSKVFLYWPFQGGTSVVVPYCYLFLMSVFILWFSYYVSDIFCKF